MSLTPRRCVPHSAGPQVAASRGSTASSPPPPSLPSPPQPPWMGGCGTPPLPARVVTQQTAHHKYRPVAAGPAMALSSSCCCFSSPHRLPHPLPTVTSTSRRVRLLRPFSKDRDRNQRLVRMDAPLQAVWATLTDYEALADFIPGPSECHLRQQDHRFARLY